ncbi:hypothetical protein L2W58_04515 [Dethiosulfovibrio sp. F2B]|uniref:hypothetical protein n=1 Tax=Dethiosulfovibrio faecalis TaxID=2720018 RepID=UPI001F1F2F79|nr:hypothetical protein [Dethiosulfovibrio faecalis]MCF4151057.1 hypothetical protein [Dethiosulfovibrio faecalis]
MNLKEILESSDRRRREALDILSTLELMKTWGKYGRPVLVGAVAYDLVLDCDIDMEIYCPTLKIEDGFEVFSRLCGKKSDLVKGCSFQNHLGGPDGALYWKLSIVKDGIPWKVDMWSAPEDYPLPRSEHFVKPMIEALTDETRKAILYLKWHRRMDPEIECPSIDLYRAVMKGGVRTPSDLKSWLRENKMGELSSWIPGRDD